MIKTDKKGVDMKVSNDFKHLRNENALLVVTGSKTAHLHVLKNGQINERDSILIETPKYSDYEGFFIKRGSRNGIAAAGTPYDNQKDYLAKLFLKNFREHVRNAMDRFNLKKIYLFGPEYFAGQEEHILPNDLKKMIVAEFGGNFTNEDLESLLRRVERQYQLEDQEANPPMGEAKNIFKNTDQGRAILGHRPA